MFYIQNLNIQFHVKNFFNNLKCLFTGKKPTHFKMKADDHSHQTVKNTSIQHESIELIAQNHSSNSFDNVQCNTTKPVKLETTNDSHNFLKKYSVHDPIKGSSIEAVSIIQGGNISMTGNSIGFGANGSISFVSQNLTGNCPICNTLIKVTKDALSRKTKLQCPNCFKEMPFRVS